MEENQYHIPVLLNESIQGLNINPDGVYIDVTFGGGGHSREILKYLNKGKLIAFDQDDDAEKNLPKSKNFFFVKSNFRYMKNFIKYLDINKVDGILADLGVSSHHFDEPERGFSYRFDAPLDMRMNQNAKISAETIVNQYSVDELTRIFRKYGEIQNAYQIANEIVRQRTVKTIQTTFEFVEAIKKHIPKKEENKYLATVFQSLRIEVNNEIKVLEDFLAQSKDILAENGRLVVITYHSLEDRLVKNFIKAGNFEGDIEKDFYGNVKTPFDAVNKKVITPTDEELQRNSRARSAKLRIATRKKD